VIADDDIRAACAKVRLASFPAGFKPHSSWHTRVQIALRGGKRLLCDSPSFEACRRSRWVCSAKIRDRVI